MMAQQTMMQESIPKILSGEAEMIAHAHGWNIRVPAGKQAGIDWKILSDGTYRILLETGARLLVYVEYSMKEGIVHLDVGDHAECVFVVASRDAQVTEEIHCGEGARVQRVAVTMPTVKAAGVRTYYLEKPHADVQDHEVVWAARQGVHEQKIHVLHAARDTTSKVRLKGVMHDASQSVVHGLVRVEKDAVRAASFLEAHALLVGKDAFAQIIPALEIETSDVQRVGHATTVSPLDEEQLFYLLARGLAEDEAKHVLVQGFVQDVFAVVPAGQQRWLMDRLEARWQA